MSKTTPPPSETALDQRVVNVNVLICAALLLQSGDVWASILGTPPVALQWAAATFYLAAAAIAITFGTRLGIGANGFFYAVAGLITFFVVSAVAAIGYGLSPVEWLPSLYRFTPILIFYVLILVRATPGEVAKGLAVASIAACGIILFNAQAGGGAFDGFYRRSIFGEDVARFVILKNECVFAVIYLFSIIVYRRLSAPWMWSAVVGVCVLIYTLIVYQQSRLGILAMVVGTAVALLAFPARRRRGKYVILYILAFGVAPAAYLFAMPHLQALSEVDLADPTGSLNTAVRVNAFSFYWDAYQATWGWGVGNASPSTSAMHPLIVGQENGWNIADIGAFESLFQFGLPGLFIFLSYNNFVIRNLLKYVRGTCLWYKAEAAGFLGLAVGFLISPLPLSFFTQAWTIHIGGILLYVSFWYSQVRTRQNQASRFQLRESLELAVESGSPARAK